MKNCKSQQKRTFDTLWEQSTAGTRLPHPTDEWMINISSKPLLVVEGVLGKHLRFATTPKCIPFPKIVAVVEGGLKKSNFQPSTVGKDNDRGSSDQIQTTTF